MPTKKSNRFIDFLDSYDKTIQYNYADFTVLNMAIRSNIYEQNLTDVSFSGKRYPKEKHISRLLDISYNYYSNYK